MAKKRIIILGAGLAGLSVAWHLKRIRTTLFVAAAMALGNTFQWKM